MTHHAPYGAELARGHFLNVRNPPMTGSMRTEHGGSPKLIGRRRSTSSDLTYAAGSALGASRDEELQRRVARGLSDEIMMPTSSVMSRAIVAPTPAHSARPLAHFGGRESSLHRRSETLQEAREGTFSRSGGHRSHQGRLGGGL